MLFLGIFASTGYHTTWIQDLHISQPISLEVLRRGSISVLSSTHSQICLERAQKEDFSVAIPKLWNCVPRKARLTPRVVHLQSDKYLLGESQVRNQIKSGIFRPSISLSLPPGLLGQCSLHKHIRLVILKLHAIAFGSEVKERDCGIWK